jgi:chromate reductase
VRQLSSPEDNLSIPGVLKNAIDWVSRMKDQPFAMRMQYHLRHSLTLFGRPEVIITFARQKFDDKLELMPALRS